MKLRCFLCVTHLLGAGHLTRTSAIATALAAEGHDVTLVSGGRPAPLARAEGVRFVQLPPVMAAPDDLRTLLDEHGMPTGADYLAQRHQRLLDAFARARPDVVLTELYPFGRRSLATEFRALLDAAASARPRVVIASSVRDILVAPDRPAKRDGTLATVAAFYDAVLVHGDPRLVPLDASWPDAPTLGDRLLYTGYVDGGRNSDITGLSERAGIVVSGGSSEAGGPLYRAAIGAAGSMLDTSWRILVGHGVGERAFAALRDGAPANAHVERARPDFRRLLAGAALFVGQCGYNTAVDLAAAGPRTLLVPFEEGGETEQRIRADCLATRGVASVLPEADLEPATLASAARAALARPLPPRLDLARDGARRTAALLAGLARERGLGAAA